MTTLINKIEHLIKREKTTPERKKKDESTKSSSEILSELFGAFNADPPKIDETTVKKSKKSKKKHKKEKKKRSRSSGSSSNSDSEYSHKRKKRKKSKSKKRKGNDKERSRSPSYTPPSTPVKVKSEKKPIKSEKGSIKPDPDIKSPPLTPHAFKHVPKEEKPSILPIKKEDSASPPIHNFYTEDIPMPLSPSESRLDSNDLRLKLESRKSDNSESEKSKGKIQIKNLKFSAVFEETVKKAEEEAMKKAKQREEGEYTDSSDSSVQETNSQFPKSSDPGGILMKKAAEEIKVSEDEKKHSKRSSSKTDSHSHKSSKRDRSRTPKSKTHRSRSRSHSRRHRRSSSKSRKRSHSRHRSSSRSKRASSRSRRPRLSPRPRRRSRSLTRRSRSRHRSSSRKRRESRSPSGVKLADSEKKRLLEVARRNAINMLKNGAVPAGAAALPPHTRNQVMAAIQSGGKSVDELTDFCKHLSKKEALGELSSVSSNDEGMSENEDTIAFHHPFLVKEKAPIVLNIRGAAPLPIKTGPTVPVANKEELRLQFPVSSGTQHREKASEWVPVSPKKDNMQVAKLNSKPEKTTPEICTAVATAPVPAPKAAPLALPAPPPVPAPDPPPYMKNFTTGAQLSSVAAPLALPAPGPQAYPPGIEPPPQKVDMAAIVSQKIAMIRREQEENELISTRGFGWSGEKPGQFTGTTGAHILTPRELASGVQAWAKKDQLQRAAPVEGGMGMALLQKMGWTPGRGLGKEGTGTLQPLLLEVKLDTKGLQAKEEAANRHARGIKCRGAGRRGPMPLVAGGKHPVSLLGEYCSKQKLGPPEYTLCFECGPDHKKNFLFKVKVAGVEYQPAVASANKKQAKADAAQLALQKLGIVT